MDWWIQDSAWDDDGRGPAGARARASRSKLLARTSSPGRLSKSAFVASALQELSCALCKGNDAHQTAFWFLGPYPRSLAHARETADHAWL
jgi:hypothetical protein